MFRVMIVVLRWLDKVFFRGFLSATRLRRLDAKTQKTFAANENKFQWFYDKKHDDELSRLATLHGSDKGSLMSSEGFLPWEPHSYTDLYGQLFDHCRGSVRRVFECGIGTNNPDLDSSMGENGRPGASLRMWRDYFPNADIFGADIDEAILFEESRIKTHYVDQLDSDSIRQLWDRLGDVRFDLMVDDGLHTFEAGSVLFENSIHMLEESGLYVIEDVDRESLESFRDFFRNSQYRVSYLLLYRPELSIGNNTLILIRK